MVIPTTPRQISSFARACLDALAQHQLGQFISLGGAFGLAYYSEYRPTHDIDAWWIEPITQQQRENVLNAIQQALQPFGEIHIREWGDVSSVELLQEGKVVFSFQIAKRSAQLSESIRAPWPNNLYLDSLQDLIASKMVALVERGAPRDFRDLYHLCQYGITNVDQCWALWETRQKLANENADLQRAKLAIRTHLARIERVRPLQAISDPDQRKEADQLRQWYKREFLGDDPN